MLCLQLLQIRDSDSDGDSDSVLDILSRGNWNIKGASFTKKGMKQVIKTFYKMNCNVGMAKKG